VECAGLRTKGSPAGTASATSDLPAAKRCRRLTLLFGLTWADGRNRPTVHGSATMRSPRLGRQGGGNGQFIEGVRHGFHEAAPDSGLLRPRLRSDVGATPWNGFFARGVLLAALIVVTLTQGLSGLKAPARNAQLDRDIEP